MNILINTVKNTMQKNNRILLKNTSKSEKVRYNFFFGITVIVKTKSNAGILQKRHTKSSKRNLYSITDLKILKNWNLNCLTMSTGTIM